jgi:C4-dicarboxylate-specific signal transduction histidine kinase
MPLEAWLQLVHADDRATVVARMRDHIAGHLPFYELEHRMVHQDGSTFWVLVRGTVATRSDSSLRVVGTITDISDRKRAEQKVQEVQAELARIGRLSALGEFAASIAHEVRQPLTAIISSARASMRCLSRGAIAEAEQALSYVLDASKRADAVIERNRELFRNRRVQKELLDCNAVVVEALAMAGLKLQGNHVSVVTALADDLPAIEGDRIELQQVLLNLIVNAIDAMASTSPDDRRLEISTARAPSGDVQVSVSDRGVGLGAVDMQRLFTLSYTTKGGGTGVGLSISRSIIEAHGGRLWAERRATGATFSFTVPPAPAASAAGDAIAV